MAILNGFLRGVYDKEVTANIDNKEYAGVATELYNFIGDRRGGMSKRAPFIFRQIADSNSYLIPYVYDQSHQYLMYFYEEDSQAKYKLLQYSQGGLEESDVGIEPSRLYPKFTSNEQDGFKITSSDGRADAYKYFNGAQDHMLSDGWWVQIEFPNPVQITKMLVSYVTSYVASIAYPMTVYAVQNYYMAFSEDGKNWVSPETTFELAGGYMGIHRFKDENKYRFVKIYTYNPYYFINNQGPYYGTIRGLFGGISILAKQFGVSEFDTPYTMEQVRQLHWANENKRMVLFHQDVQPQQITQTMVPLNQTGLNFDTLGYPSFGCFYQERLCLGGFSKANRQFNMSQSNPNDDAGFNFTLPTNTITSTAAMRFTIRNAKYALKESLAGRNVVYLQCIDGLATVSSGGDEVPLTPVQVSANLRNHTPFSDIPAVHQEEIAFLVGSDYQTIYAMDFDYNVMRVRTLAVNDHCRSYFESGIAQMTTMHGKIPYLVFRLNNGGLVVAISYRTETGFAFHAFPMKINGEAISIATLLNDVTGYDTLFALIRHSNGIVLLESVESVIEQYTAEKGRQYFIDNVALDAKSKLAVPKVSSTTFIYDGTVSKTGRRYLKIESGDAVELPNKEIKVIFGDEEIICKDCDWDNGGFWADMSKEPPLNIKSLFFSIPQDIWELPQYYGAECLAFDGDDFISVENYNEQENIESYIREITIQTMDLEPSDEDQKNTAIIQKVRLARPIYNGVIGIPYKARGEYENLTDAAVAGYEKTINNISACITYGTGLKLGTESTLEKIGFSNYLFKDWQDRILPDESLKNIPLTDTARKDKKIVIECDYPFPADVTFVVYDLKTTGVR